MAEKTTEGVARVFRALGLPVPNEDRLARIAADDRSYTEIRDDLLAWGQNQGEEQYRSMLESLVRSYFEATNLKYDDARIERIAGEIISGERTVEEVRTTIEELDQEGGDGVRGKEGVSGEQREFIEELMGGGSPEIWYDSEADKWYLVYIIPDTDVPLLYEADKDNLDALFPEGNYRYDRQITTDEIAQRGGIYAGTAEDPYGDPYATFIEQLEKEAEIKPWLKDPDMMALMFEAILEGREISPGELMTTEWWRTHSEAERAWMILVHGDPSEAEAVIQTTRINTANQLRQLGVNNAPDELIDWLATRLYTGEWTEAYWSQQLIAVADPFSGREMDPELQKRVNELNSGGGGGGLGQGGGGVGGDGLDTTRAQEDRVRAEVLKWLGPVYGNWSQDQIAEWAGKLRNDPDALTELTEMLRKQRLAMFPEYENPNLKYEDIAGPWKNLWTSIWGQPPDETDPLFTEVMKVNDYNEAAKKLRREGLRRDVSGVKQDIERAAVSANQLTRSTF